MIFLSMKSANDLLAKESIRAKEQLERLYECENFKKGQIFLSVYSGVLVSVLVVHHEDSASIADWF